MKKWWQFAFLLLVLGLSGCATTGHQRYWQAHDGAPTENIDVSKIPDAVPKVEPRSKYGNPASYVALGRRYFVMNSAEGYHEKGIASWYGTKFHGQRTSCGEPYDLKGMTAAHRTLPLPTYVQVTNLTNHRQVIVKVNDRGPFAENRIMDLSYVAAKKLGVTARGTALVEVRAIDPRNPQAVINKPLAPELHGKPLLYLQIGAFSQQVNAVKTASLVKTWTASPVVVKAGQRNGIAIYRVQIGPLPSVDNSDALYDRLKAAGLGQPIVVVD
jgi:rare lipoprotein A